MRIWSICFLLLPMTKKSTSACVFAISTRQLPRTPFADTALKSSRHSQNNPSMQDILRLAQSPAGQQLIQMLQKSGGQELKDAMEKAAAGDYSKAKETLSSLMKDPEAKKLMEQLGR